MSDAPAETVKHRFPVDMTGDEVELERRMATLLRVLPSGSAWRSGAFGFTFRREPDVFAAISTGASLGMAILLAESTWRARYVSYVVASLSALFFVTAAVQITRFASNALRRVEVSAAGGEIIQSITSAWRVKQAMRVHADKVVAVLVVQDEGRPARVVLGGPRHAVLAEVYRTRMLDPDRMAPWMAEMVALVARRASSREA